MTLLNLFVTRYPHNYVIGMDASFIVFNTKAALKRGAFLGRGWGGPLIGEGRLQPTRPRPPSMGAGRLNCSFRWCAGF